MTNEADCGITTSTVVGPEVSPSAFSGRYHLEAFMVQHTKAPLPDVTFILGSYQWQIHSDVLSKTSEFFKIALQGAFKVDVFISKVRTALTTPLGS